MKPARQKVVCCNMFALYVTRNFINEFDFIEEKNNKTNFDLVIFRLLFFLLNSHLKIYPTDRGRKIMFAVPKPNRVHSNNVLLIFIEAV